MKKNLEMKFHSNETIEQHCMQIWIEIQLNWIQIQLKRNGIQITEKRIEILQIFSIICNYNIGGKRVLKKTFPFHLENIPNQKLHKILY
jgi:hypothetical protein